MSAPEKVDPRARLLTIQFWTGIALAPLAALLLVMRASTAAAALAIIAVVILGLAVVMRREDAGQKPDLEETLLDEIDMLRDDVRADITTAARATHRALAEKVATLQETISALQRQAELARAAAEAPVSPPAPSPPPAIRRAGVAAVGPGPAVRRTEVVQVTTRQTIVDPVDDDHDEYPRAGYRSRTSRPGDRADVHNGHSGGGRVGGEGGLQRRGRDDGPPDDDGHGSYRSDGRYTHESSDRDRGVRATEGAGWNDVPRARFDRDPLPSDRGGRVHEPRARDGRLDEQRPAADRPAGRSRADRSGDGRTRVEQPNDWHGSQDDSDRPWAGRGAGHEADRRSLDTGDRDYLDGPASTAGSGHQARALTSGREEPWTDQRSRSYIQPVDPYADSGEIVAPVRGRLPGRPDDPADDDRWSAMRSGDRWAEVHEDERGRELRMGERRSERRVDETGTQVRIVDRWSSVRHEKPRAADDPPALRGGRQADREAGRYTGRRAADGDIGRRAADGHRDDQAGDNTGETRSERRRREEASERDVPDGRRPAPATDEPGRAGAPTRATALDDDELGWGRPVHRSSDVGVSGWGLSGNSVDVSKPGRGPRAGRPSAGSDGGGEALSSRSAMSAPREPDGDNRSGDRRTPPGDPWAGSGRPGHSPGTRPVRDNRLPVREVGHPESRATQIPRSRGGARAPIADDHYRDEPRLGLSTDSEGGRGWSDDRGRPDYRGHAGERGHVDEHDDDRWVREPGARAGARPRRVDFEVTDDRWN